MSSLTASAVSVETEEVSEADDKTAKISVERGLRKDMPIIEDNTLDAKGLKVDP